jgi:serine/threonine protein kinase
MVSRIGEQLGNYRLTQLLGSGSFAEVYLGEHVLISLKVAIKILHTKVAAEYRETFLKEAEALVKLTHKNIVSIRDYGVIDGENTPYIIMEYAPNGTMRKLYPGGTIVPLTLAASYGEQISSALAYAHNQGLIHRDLKPENLLLETTHNVLVSDFGLVALAYSTGNIATSLYAGTLIYSAPEQILGKSRRESDQYALGIIMYEWLCGETPFKGTMMEVTTQHLHAPIPSFQEKGVLVHPEIEKIIRKALEKEPKDRFSGIQDFAMAFKEASSRSDASTIKAVRPPNQPSGVNTVTSIKNPPQEQPTELVKRPQQFIKDVSQIQPAPMTPATIQMTNPYEKERKEKERKRKKILIILLVMLLLSIMITCGVFVVRKPTASSVSTLTRNVQSSPIATTKPTATNPPVPPIPGPCLIPNPSSIKLTTSSLSVPLTLKSCGVSGTWTTSAPQTFTDPNNDGGSFIVTGSSPSTGMLNSQQSAGVTVNVVDNTSPATVGTIPPMMGTISFKLTSSADPQQTFTRIVPIDFTRSFQAYGNVTPNSISVSEPVSMSHTPVQLTASNPKIPDSETLSSVTATNNSLDISCNSVQLPPGGSAPFNCTFTDNGVNNMTTSGTITFTFTDAASNTSFPYTVQYTYTSPA